MIAPDLGSLEVRRESQLSIDSCAQTLLKAADTSCLCKRLSESGKEISKVEPRSEPYAGPQGPGRGELHPSPGCRFVGP
jgi:hypothetical protein